MAERPTLKQRIRAAVAQREAGDLGAARVSLEALRAEAVDARPFDRLFFAHSYADVQTDLEQELHWDEVALAAFDELTEADVEAEGVPGGKAGLLPSLHLNLADVLRRLGRDEAEVRRHYDAGARHLGALDDSGYGDSIRQAFAAFEV